MAIISPYVLNKVSTYVYNALIYVFTRTKVRVYVTNGRNVYDAIHVSNKTYVVIKYKLFG